MEFDKSKILTSVTADQAKVGQKGWIGLTLSDLKYSFGKEDKKITLLSIRGENVTTRFVSDKYGAELLFYPAPEPIYRPFKNAEEFKLYRDEWFVTTFPNGEQSHFKVIDYCDTGIVSVGGYSTDSRVKLSFCTYAGMFKWVTRENGEPCGVREEA